MCYLAQTPRFCDPLQFTGNIPSPLVPHYLSPILTRFSSSICLIFILFHWLVVEPTQNSVNHTHNFTVVTWILITEYQSCDLITALISLWWPDPISTDRYEVIHLGFVLVLSSHWASDRVMSMSLVTVTLVAIHSLPLIHGQTPSVLCDST